MEAVLCVIEIWSKRRVWAGANFGVQWYFRYINLIFDDIWLKKWS